MGDSVSYRWIPGTMPSATIEALGQHQKQFMADLMEKPEVTARYDKAYTDWVKSTGPKRGLSGADPQE